MKSRSNSLQNVLSDTPLIELALTCPFLPAQGVRQDPYSLVEVFFSYTTPFGYRKHLSLWFKCALSEGIMHPKPIELIYLFNQFQTLLGAGYLIATDTVDVPDYAIKGQLHYGQSLLNASSKSKLGELVVVNHEIQLLNEAERDDPMAFIQKTLIIDIITNLRFGLKEWLEAALTENDSIAELDAEYLFDMFELLQKITEAFYIVLVSPILIENHKKN